MDIQWTADEPEVSRRVEVEQHLPSELKHENDESEGFVSCEMQDTGNQSADVQYSELYLQECFRDHFTLSAPSSLVRFRSTNTAARVFENGTSQFILEERIDPLSQQRRIFVKQLSDGTTGLQFLRGIYTVMCIFWTGIFFVLCLQILVVMVLEMAIQVGTTEINPHLDVFRLLG